MIYKHVSVSAKICVALFIILTSIGIKKSAAEENCNNIDDFLNLKVDISCDDEFSRKEKAIDFVLNFDEIKLGSKIDFISPYEESTGAWELISLKIVADAADGKLSRNELDELYTRFELLLSIHRFKFEEKFFFKLKTMYR